MKSEKGVVLLRKRELSLLGHPIPAHTDSQEEVSQPCHTSALDHCPWSGCSPRKAAFYRARGLTPEPPRGNMTGSGWVKVGVLRQASHHGPLNIQLTATRPSHAKREQIALTLIQIGMPFSKGMQIIFTTSLNLKKYFKMGNHWRNVLH